VFPKDVPEAFTRDYGCTEADWLRALPEATARHALQPAAPGAATVRLDGGGSLHLSWQGLPPRQVALVRLPRLQVDFRFEATADADRSAFMRYFDLVLQRGGG
jgi:hypothetical protein